MSTDNKRQLILFDVTGLPIENVQRELATCVREVFDHGRTIHAEPYGEHNYIVASHIGLSNTTLAVVPFFYAIT